jgi:predicted transcriptional regulator
MAHGRAYVGSVEVQLTPEQEQQLFRLANEKGSTTVTLANQAIVQFLETESHLMAATEIGDEALDRGEYLTHEQVGARLKELFNSSR